MSAGMDPAAVRAHALEVATRAGITPQQWRQMDWRDRERVIRADRRAQRRRSGRGGG